MASVSPLGHDPDTIWESYLDPKPKFLPFSQLKGTPPVAYLDETSRQIVEALRSESRYKSLDDSVLFAIAASRQAVKNAGWKRGDSFGVNIGSSRGATGLFEKYHADFLSNDSTATLTSPTTTLGNIASWVAQDLQSNGPEISHSITCSTALHAMLNGIAWLRAGMADKFLVGGSEAPLTPFTIAQMQAMKIYSREPGDYPCRALDLEKKQNTMVLGEAASVCCLETGISEKALAIVEGIGYATELLEHSTSISAEAECFKKSMKMALGNIAPAEIDAIVMHAPGTVAGDLAEYKAIQSAFGENLPMLTTTKWKTAHTFGASGMLSIELAVLMLQRQEFTVVPFAKAQPQRAPIRKILVNAVGFGGNAVSILLSAS